MDIRKSFTVLMTLLLAAGLCLGANPKSYSLSSPNGRITVKINTGSKINYSVLYNNGVVISPSEIGMTLEDGTVYGGSAQPVGFNKRVVNKTIDAVAYKRAKVKDHFNELTIKFKEFNLIFRAYDKGVAYRFTTNTKRLFTVKEETAEFSFPADWNSYVGYSGSKGETIESQYVNDFESLYNHVPVSGWERNRLAYLPALFEAPSGVKVLITEADLRNYPGMFLHGDGSTTVRGNFAPYPTREAQGGHNMLEGIVKERGNYIASGTPGQKFPWRVIAVVPEAAQLANLDLVYCLAEPAADTDWSWVKPGKAAWEWWNSWNIYGVDFESGINTETYKYYIDFAAKFGLEYILIDEGWTEKGEADLFKVVPELDLKEVIDYAAKKNVGIFLWTGYWAFNKDMNEACRHYSKLGIKGFKIDFMNRDDQPMIEFQQKAAAMGAKYHLLIDFHGTSKPAGLQRTYPNVLNYEGVRGLEHLKWGTADQVVYECTIPFIRMAAGPLDYTPGAMRNATQKNFRPVSSEAMSQGTRCRQLAEYIVLDAPLAMLCDSPSNYYSEEECTEFIASVPTSWDETVMVSGEIGEYVAIARRKGEKWYVGAITNWTPREMDLELGFITSASVMTVFHDGANADKVARDYMKEEEDFPENGRVRIKMAPGGGWAAIIK